MAYKRAHEGLGHPIGDPVLVMDPVHRRFTVSDAPRVPVITPPLDFIWGFQMYGDSGFHTLDVPAPPEDQLFAEWAGGLASTAISLAADHSVGVGVYTNRPAPVVITLLDELSRRQRDEVAHVTVAAAPTVHPHGLWSYMSDYVSRHTKDPKRVRMLQEESVGGFAVRFDDTQQVTVMPVAGRADMLAGGQFAELTHRPIEITETWHKDR